MKRINRADFLRASPVVGAAVLSAAIFPTVQIDANGMNENDSASDPELVQYWSESFTNYVVPGGATVTSIGGLELQVTSAVIYVAGIRGGVSAQSLSSSDDADNYIDAALDGAYHGTPVAIGASPPPLYPSSIRVAKVTAQNGIVIANQDLRVFSPLGSLAATSASTLVTLQQSGIGHTIDIPVTNNNSAGIYMARSGTSAAIYIVDQTSDPSGTHDLIDLNNTCAGDGIFVNNHGTGGSFKCFVGADSGDLSGIGIQTQVWNGVGLIVQNQGDVEHVTISFENNAATNADFFAIGINGSSVSRAIDISNSGVGTAIFVTQLGNGRALQINQYGNDNAFTVVKPSGPGSSIFVSDYSTAPALWVQKSVPGNAAMFTKFDTGAGDCVVISNSGTGNDISGTNGSWEISNSGYANFSQSGIRTKYLTQSPTLTADGDHQIYWDGTTAWAYWKLNGATYRAQLTLVS